MANEKDPTVKDEVPEAEGASTDTTEPLTAIFQGLDGKKIRKIISVGQAMLQERMATAIDKVLSAHLQGRLVQQSCQRSLKINAVLQQLQGKS